MSNTALLVIDMQVGVVEGAQAVARLDQVLDKLNVAIAKARHAGYPVLFVQHEDEELVPGSASWQLHAKLASQEKDLRVRKRYGDSFCETTLASLLAQHGVEHLWLGGCATDFCLDSTLRNAVSRGYQVTVIGDAHTAQGVSALTGEQVIDHFNAAWGATRATPKPLRVVQAEAL